MRSGDCGYNETTGWRPGNFLRTALSRTHIDYLLITNVDQDHISDLDSVRRSGISIAIRGIELQSAAQPSVQGISCPHCPIAATSSAGSAQAPLPCTPIASAQPTS